MQHAAIDPRVMVKLADLSPQTLQRNLDGKPERSFQALNAIREVLMESGATVEPVPSEADDWIDPAERPANGTPRLAPELDAFRRNLVRFREERGLMDLHEAAKATGISLETLRAYELGEQPVSGMHLLRLAEVYDRRPEHFEMAEPPAREHRAAPAVHARVVGSLEDMTPEHRARVQAIERELATINAAERQRLEDAKKPKRR